MENCSCRDCSAKNPPFEKMGKKAVELMDKIVNQGVKKEQLVTGPYLFEDALLIDKHNVPPEGQWPQL